MAVVDYLVKKSVWIVGGDGLGLLILDTAGLVFTLYNAILRQKRQYSCA